MKRLLLALLAVVAAGAGTAPLWAPPLLARTPWFPTERVEVTGARLLAPQEVLAASGIRMRGSLWRDPARWEAALRRHPVIAEARVSRRLPGTLRVRVTEKTPVALVQGETLVPATAEGEVLPVDPSRVPLDLPLLRGRAAAGRDRRLRDAAVRALLAETGRLERLDPALAARVSEVRAGPGGSLRLVLSAPAAEVLLPPGAGAGRLRQLHAVLADVRRRLPAEGAAGTARIDLRYADQVVVRLPQLARTAEPHPTTVPR